MRNLTLKMLLLPVLLLTGVGKSFAGTRTEIDAIPVAVCKSGNCKVPVTSASVAKAEIGTQISSFFSSLFDTSQWPDRWNCGVWTPFHGWVYIISDLLIWLSYFAIPMMLAYFVYKKRIDDIPFKTVVVLFIGFILACGLTHLMDAAIFWWPAYKLSALLRFVTALVSLVTVFALAQVIPGILELKSPAFLEKQVQLRTQALQESNEKLNFEMLERRRISNHLKSSNQELLAFSYSISHDLRAPLRSIHGFSQALQEDYASQLDKEGKDYLARICHASARMGELIDDLLKLSKISRNDIAVQDIDLSAMVEDIVEDQVQRNPAIKTSFEIEAGLRVRADHKLLKIAVENLVDNAIKYTSKTPRPAMKFGQLHGKSVFYIKDNGAGFDMQFSDKLFGAFQRLHEGEFEGSGIGLATVKRIILKHGGTIWAEAKVDEGATFYFTV